MSIKNYMGRKVLGLAFSVLDRYFLSGPRHNIDIIRVARTISAQSSGQFFLDEMPLAKNLHTSEKLLNFAIDSATLPGLILEFGVWKGASIKKIAEWIKSYSKSPSPIVHVKKRTSEVHRLTCNYRLAKKLFNWRPRYSVEEGLRKNIDWAKRNWV